MLSSSFTYSRAQSSSEVSSFFSEEYGKKSLIFSEMKNGSSLQQQDFLCKTQQPFFSDFCSFIHFTFLFSIVSIDFFLIGIHSMQGWTANTRHGVTRKTITKRLQHTRNLFRKNLQLKVSVNSRLKATKTIGPRKAFYRQRIPESSCVRRNGDTKIMQCISCKIFFKK